MNGNDGPGPLNIEARRELLKRLLALQEETHVEVISPEELLLIQQMWKAARDPDDGRGVTRIINKQRGIIMSANLRELNRLRELEEEVAREKAIDADTLRRMVAKVEEYSESHRAHGLPDALLNILKDDLEAQSNVQKA
jgi:DNA sulfur modification protein DndC